MLSLIRLGPKLLRLSARHAELISVSTRSSSSPEVLPRTFYPCGCQTYCSVPNVLCRCVASLKSCKTSNSAHACLVTACGSIWEIWGGMGQFSLSQQHPLPVSNLNEQRWWWLNTVTAHNIPAAPHQSPLTLTDALRSLFWCHTQLKNIQFTAKTFVIGIWYQNELLIVSPFTTRLMELQICVSSEFH